MGKQARQEDGAFQVKEWSASSRRLALLILSALVIAVSPGCGGCSSPPQGESAKRQSEPPLNEHGDMGEEDPPFGVGAFLPVIRFRVEGEPDVHNRYPSVVRITPMSPELIEGLRSCSGVIVSPRVVLTAGHCFCRHRQVSTPEGSLERQIDGTSCAEAATVDVFFYEEASRSSRRAVGSTTAHHQGRIHPHPQLEVRLNAQGAVLSSHADLAVVSLDTPVPVGFRPIQLDPAPVVPHESLVLVGFGHAEDLGWLDDTRLINAHRVVAAMDEHGERFQLERGGESFFRGDSGGPCLRESPRGPLLVGISTTGLGQEPSLTALHLHREWLQQEILRAETTRPDSTGL